MIPMKKHGKLIGVARPKDAKLALRLLDQIDSKFPPEEQERRFQEIISAQPYSYIGLACKTHPVILDPKTHQKIDTLRPGDSFVDAQ